MEQENDTQNQYSLPCWWDHRMMNVCVCLSLFACVSQYHWTPDNIKSCYNGTQTVSVSGPWALLIHCLIDNLCSRPCMGLFRIVCVRQCAHIFNSNVLHPTVCWPARWALSVVGLFLCVCVCVCVCVCICQMHKTCWQVISQAKASHWGIIARSHTHTHTHIQWGTVIQPEQLHSLLWLYCFNNIN